MFRLSIFALLCVGLALALPSAKKVITQELVDKINADGKFTAKLHARFADMTTKEAKTLMGALKRADNPNNKNNKVEPMSTINPDELPEKFDARDNWPKCKSVIGNIVDQSACGSCWSVSSSSVMSDRVCIATDGQNKNPISAVDVLSCCWSCGFGCQGGYPDEAFNYWMSSGVVTGSSYKLDAFCKPYLFAECEHHTNKTKYPACPKQEYDTPECATKCQPSYKTHTYKQDKYKGKKAKFLSRDINAIKKEIMENGPVVFTYDVYEDFVAYAGGVYEHTYGNYLGGHAVRAIGWGEENGKKYWLIANSWNEDWGMDGYFKIVLGKNDCGIENEVSAALADSAKMPKAA